MNFDKMSDTDINATVTYIDYGCDGWELSSDKSYFYHCGIGGESHETVRIPDYCNDPSYAWPIIVDNKIQLSPSHAANKNKDVWTASDGFMPPESYHLDKNPLRAAMICFLKMKEQEDK